MELLGAARAAGMGIIIKRPVGNGAWGSSSSPYRYTDEYLRRAQIMSAMGPISGAPEDPILLAMGFLFAHDEVDTAIVGTHNPAHLRANIEMVESDLPIPSEAVEELHRRFDAVGEEWPTNPYGRYHRLRDVARQPLYAPRPFDSCSVTRRGGGTVVVSSEMWLGDLWFLTPRCLRDVRSSSSGPSKTELRTFRWEVLL